MASAMTSSTAISRWPDRKAFEAWCEAEGRTAVPASGETMAEWVQHLTVTPRKRTGAPAGPSTVERAMSAVTTWHEEQGHPKPNMRGARAVLNAYKARAGGWVDGSRVLARYMDDVDRAKNSPWSASACEGGEGAHARHP
ncbi:hypothetical protein [Streptomyces sp. NPDC054771]